MDPQRGNKQQMLIIQNEQKWIALLTLIGVYVHLTVEGVILLDRDRCCFTAGGLVAEGSTPFLLVKDLGPAVNLG